MSLSLKFHSVHGDNVSRTRNGRSVSWHHVYSGGLVFSANQLAERDDIKITLRGTTSADIGFTKVDPEVLDDLRSAYEQDKVTFLGNVNINKGQFKVQLKRENGMIVYRYGTFPTSYEVNSESVWIAVYLQFGNCRLKMADNRNKSPLKWHKKCGEHVEFQDAGDRFVANLKDKNPAGFACVPLHPSKAKGIKVRLSIKPCKEGLKTYGLSVYSSSLSPRDLQETSDLFTVLNMQYTKARDSLILLEKYERQSRGHNFCDGELEIEVYAGGEIRFKHSADGSCVANVKSSLNNDDITLLFNLYLTRLEILEAQEIPIEQDNDSSDALSSITSDESTFIVATGSEFDSCSSSCMSIPITTEEDTSNVHRKLRSASSVQQLPDGINVSPDKSNIVNIWINDTATVGTTSNTEVQTVLTYDNILDTSSSPQNISPEKRKRQMDSYEKHTSGKRVSSLSVVSPGTSSDYALNDQGITKSTVDSSGQGTTGCETELQTSTNTVKDNIIKNFVYLVQNVEAFPLCDHLLQENIFTSCDYQSIRKISEQQSSDNVNRELLTILKRKQLTKSVLITALKESELSYLIDKFV